MTDEEKLVMVNKENTKIRRNNEILRRENDRAFSERNHAQDACRNIRTEREHWKTRYETLLATVKRLADQCVCQAGAPLRAPPEPQWQEEIDGPRPFRVRGQRVGESNDT